MGDLNRNKGGNYYFYTIILEHRMLRDDCGKKLNYLGGLQGVKLRVESISKAQEDVEGFPSESTAVEGR